METIRNQIAATALIFAASGTAAGVVMEAIDSASDRVDYSVQNTISQASSELDLTEAGTWLALTGAIGTAACSLRAMVIPKAQRYRSQDYYDTSVEG